MSDSSLPNAIVAYLRAQSNGSDDKYSQAADLVASRAGLTEAQLASPPAPGLEAIWNVFLKTQSKAAPAAAPKESDAPAASSSTAATTEGSSPSAEDKAEAEKLKAEGNKAMSSKDYGAAIAAYTKAIKLDATSPVYFSNRAAAYSQAGAHDRAVEDAEAALKLDANFSKAYSRKGHALFSLGDYSGAVESYQKGLELEPTSKVMQAGLDSAKKHAADSGSNDVTPTSRDTGADAGAGAGDGAGAGSNPFAGLGGLGGGGMPNLSEMMNNPQMQQMAQQMMQNGSLSQLMQNPMLRQMAERMGQNGGTPDFSQIQQMMQDPQMMQLAQSMMGGLGGLGGMGGGR